MLLRVLLLSWLVFFIPGFAAADGDADARKLVDELNSTLIDVMKGGAKLGYEGRYRKLDPVVRKAFEFEGVSAIALGSYWKKLDTGQQAAFISKLTELSIATYAAQFKSYSSESFQYDSSQNLKNGRLLLRYNLTAPKEKPIRFEYSVGQVGGRWYILNIVVDGISDLALKKAQYTSVIEREGFDSLLGKLNQKIADYARNNAS